LVILLLIDLSAMLIQKPYLFLDNSKIAELASSYKNGNINGRVLVLYKNRATLWASTNVIDTGVSTPFGGIPQAATKSLPYVTAITAKSALELFDRNISLSSESYDNFRLLNIQHILIPEKNSTVHISNAYPIWFSNNIGISEANPELLESETWASMREKYEKRELDYKTTSYIVEKILPEESKPVVKRILLHNEYMTIDTNGFIDKNLSQKEQLDVNIIDFFESNSFVKIEYRSNKDAFALLSYSYFPYNIVTIDGKSLLPYRSASNFYVIPVPEGKHIIEISPKVSTLRKLLLIVAAISFMVVLTFLFAEKKHKN